MSHFTVLVIGEKPEEQLVPFQENNCGDCPKEFLQFNDTEDDYLNDYETGGTEMAVMPDGSFKHTWDDAFRVPGSFGTGTGTHKVPDGLEVRRIAHKDRFATFESFVESWHGAQKRDEKTNRYGYWENPNAKWDWYKLGGRWTGFFKAKSGASGVVGNPGLMSAPAKAGFVDQLYKRDIDLQSMMSDAAKKAGDTWDMVHEAIAGTQPSDSWEHVRENLYKDDIKGARAYYQNQPRVEAFNAFVSGNEDKFGHFANVDKYNCSRDEFVKSAEDGCIATLAVVKDGKWHERGEMGWWGMITEKMGDNDWNAKFRELIESVPDDTLLSIYDCHI